MASIAQPEDIPVVEPYSVAVITADTVHEAVVIKDTMHVLFTHDQPTADGRDVERVLSGRIEIKMSGVPRGLFIVSTRYAGQKLAYAPDQMMGWFVAAHLLL